MHRFPVSRMNLTSLTGTTAVGQHFSMRRSLDDVDAGIMIQNCNKRRSILERHMSSAMDDTALASVHTLKPYTDMPGPKGLPVIGSLWDYLKKDGYRFNKMFEAMMDLSHRYGPVFREKIGGLEHVVISDPIEYAKVIRVDGRYPERIALEPMVHYKKLRGMSLGTVNSQGEEWYRNRMVVAKKTLRPKEIIQYIPAMNDVANDFVERAMTLLTPQGHVPELEHEIFKWAFESIGTFLFEERIGCLENEPSPEAQAFLRNLVGFFKYMQPLMYNVPVYKYYRTPMWKKYEHHADQVTQIGMRYINKKIAELQAADPKTKQGDIIPLLTYFLSHKDLTPDEANSHALDIMMGGVETTSNATLWTLYLLALSPTVQDTLYEEICNILPDKEQITAKNLNQLYYVKACLKETFRLYPITFATSRIIHDDIELGGFHVPAGTHCQANLYGMGRDSKIFSEPLEYRPERWLRANREGPVQTLASLIWGHGPRMCLGRRLAEQEIHMAVTKIIQNFKVRYNGPVIEPVLNTVMTPDQPVKLIFIPRK